MDPLDNHDTHNENHHSHHGPTYPFDIMTDREEVVQSTPWHTSNPYPTSSTLASNSLAIQPTLLTHSILPPSSVAPTGHFSESSRSISFIGSANEFDPSRTYSYSVPFVGHHSQQLSTGGYYHPRNELKQPVGSDGSFALQTAPVVQDTEVSANPPEAIRIPYSEQSDLGSESDSPLESSPQMISYSEPYTVSIGRIHDRLHHHEAHIPTDSQSYTRSSSGHNIIPYASQANPLTREMTEGDIGRQYIHQPGTSSFLPFSPTVNPSSQANIPTHHPTEYPPTHYPQTHQVPSLSASYYPDQPVGVSIRYPTIVETEMPLGPRPEALQQRESSGEGWGLNPSVQPSRYSSTVEDQSYYNELALVPPHPSDLIIPVVHRHPPSAVQPPSSQQYHQFLQPSLQQQQRQISRQTTMPHSHNVSSSPATSSSSKPSQSLLYLDQEHNSIPNATSAYSSMRSRSRSISHSATSSSPVPHNTFSSALKLSIMAPSSQREANLADSGLASTHSLTFTDWSNGSFKSTLSSLETAKGSSKQSANSKKKKRTIHPNPPLASCSLCQKPLMRLLMRGTMEDWEIDWVGWWVCQDCSENHPDVTSRNGFRSGAIRSGVAYMGSANLALNLGKGKRRDRTVGSLIGQSTCGSIAGAGGVGRRKRTRETMNTEAPLVCDVCFKFKGQGGIIPRDGRGELKFSVEFVCVSCEEKYRRCTDCGSGGGARIGIGKWRSKELFINNRKTCSLSHVRIGSAPIKVGTWSVKDIKDEHVWDELLNLCEALWKDRLLSRTAIPDVLEANLGDLNDRPRVFADVQATLDAGWPGRQPLIDARQDVMFPQSSSEFPFTFDDDRDRSERRSRKEFRKYLGLTWCKCKPRRSGQASTCADSGNGDSGLGGRLGLGDGVSEDIKEAQQSGKESGEDSVAHEKTESVIPSGYELVGLYIGDWNIHNGTLLITTSLPFEGSDSDDRTTLTVGEMILRVVTEIDETNAALPVGNQFQRRDQEKRKIPFLEHLWCISDGTTSQIREKMHESLTRKRQFLPLDEYLAQHPTVQPEVFHELPYSLPGPWVDGVGIPGTIMARWLGPHFDRKQLEESVAKNDIAKKSIKAKVIKE